MIDWVLALLISDIRHSDLAHQGMTSNATYSTHPPLITFILIILSHFTSHRDLFLMWLDRVAFCETMFLVIDQSKDKTRFKQLTFLFALPFAFWFSQNVLVPCECFLSIVASLALQSTVSIVCCFLPSFYLVFLPLEFGYPSFLASLSVLFSGFIYDYVFLLSADALFIPSHTIWFHELRLRWMDYSATSGWSSKWRRWIE